ncbi:Hypothetical predicted protein [Marmota monax]|uniref:Uncharacterized protein n=1 Tax=Marmota monax TaxID=9995 RepID=A0A5E4D4I7_MARMO|nr:hypothetical protein GHT09_015214 [Marmota monax]VTJ88222.1 Hypothetical predicted protein [Marmota monax]
MGKVRGLRARVHQAAVRPKGEAAPGPAPPVPRPEVTLPPASAGVAGAKDWAFIHTDVFAKTQIDPSALVQRLELDQTSLASLRKGAEAKAILPKKEKLRLRRERWLQTGGTSAITGLLHQLYSPLGGTRNQRQTPKGDPSAAFMTTGVAR